MIKHQDRKGTLHNTEEKQVSNLYELADILGIDDSM
jgi:hypothetical protein